MRLVFKHSIYIWVPFEHDTEPQQFKRTNNRLQTYLYVLVYADNDVCLSWIPKSVTHIWVEFEHGIESQQLNKDTTHNKHAYMC